MSHAAVYIPSFKTGDPRTAGLRGHMRQFYIPSFTTGDPRTAGMKCRMRQSIFHPSRRATRGQPEFMKCRMRQSIFHPSRRGPEDSRNEVSHAAVYRPEDSRTEVSHAAVYIPSFKTGDPRTAGLKCRMRQSIFHPSRRATRGQPD